MSTHGSARRLQAPQLFLPVALSSTLGVLLFMVRVYETNSLVYLCLIWNLFLAWVPYWCAVWAAATHERQPGAWWRLVMPAGLWLLFLPNAPYLATEFVHLQEYPLLNLWYDMGMTLVFAWSGCLLAVASLRMLHQIADFYLRPALSWLFVVASTLACGVGVYIGRVLRWNSWDVLRDPLDLLADIAAHAPRREAVGVTLLFTAILLIGYMSFPWARERAPLAEAGPPPRGAR